MTRTSRGTVAAAATAVALIVLAPAASGAYAPLLTATAGADSAVRVDYSQKGSEDGAASLAFYAPAGFASKLPTATGSDVGTASANAIAGDAGGSTMSFVGTIRVADASTPLSVGTAATAGAASDACGGPGTPVSLWVASLTGFAQRLDLTFSVQRVPSGQLAIVTCLPAADVPAGTAGRAPLGLKVVRLSLRLTRAFGVPRGLHFWHLRATPYTPKTATANGSAAVEAEAAYGLPQVLTLTTLRAAAAGRVRVAGRLTLGGTGVAAATVQIRGGGRTIGKARTDASGRYAATVAAKRSMSAKAVVPARYFESCLQPAFAPLPCVSSIRAGFTATSATVRFET